MYEMTLDAPYIRHSQKPFQRYLLPRLAQSYQARLALRKHQSTLIARLTESASALKASQAESYKDLPRIVPIYEDSQHAQCHAIDDVLSHAGSSGEESIHPGADIPDVTILRCALEELGCSKTDGTSTEELFRYLESKLPWLGREDGAARQVRFTLFLVHHLTSTFPIRTTFGTNLMLVPCLCPPRPNRAHPTLCHYITRHGFFGSTYLPPFHPHHLYLRAWQTCKHLCRAAKKPCPLVLVVHHQLPQSLLGNGRFKSFRISPGTSQHKHTLWVSPQYEVQMGPHLAEIRSRMSSVAKSEH